MSSTISLHHTNENEHLANSVCRLHSHTPPTLRTKAQLNKIITNGDGSPDHLAINIYDDLKQSSHTSSEYRFKDRNNFSRYRKCSLHWDKIPRANDPSKTLQEKAVNLLSNFVFKLNKFEDLLLSESANPDNAAIIVNHDYLSRVTKCKRDQNVNLLKQLNAVLDIKFYTVVSFRGKTYRNSYLVRHTKQGRAIIHNYEVAEDALEEKFQQNIIDEQESQSQELSTDGGGLKNSKCAEFFRPCSYIYKDKNNRSAKSNFLNKLFLEKISRKSSEERKTTEYKKRKSLEPRNLESFYPLSDGDVSELQSSSGRNFTRRAMNEILKDMAKKVTSAEFYSKKGFMAYMSKAFKYEKRNELLVSSESFYIKNNLTLEEQRAISQEKYLSEVEYSLEVNPEAHLRKKLAAVLESSKACQVLKSWKSARRVEGIFEITLSKPVDLTRMDREIIHKSVLATAPPVPGETIPCIERTEIKMPNAKLSQNSSQINYKQEKADPEDYIKQALPDNAWGRIRKKIISENRTNAKDGVGIDISWFAKLKEDVDEQAKSISLKAPSEFVKDWIGSKYMELLKGGAESIGYTLKQIE